MRTLEAFVQGYGSPQTDPPATTPYEIAYEGGMLRLRHYRPAERRHKSPLLRFMLLSSGHSFSISNQAKA